MAIKVNNITVINDSLGLENINQIIVPANTNPSSIPSSNQVFLATAGDGSSLRIKNTSGAVIKLAWDIK